MARKPLDPKLAMQMAMDLCARARAQGRHSSDASDWCQACGEKVKAIYHVLLDGKRICILCAARGGIRNAEHDLQKHEPELFTRLEAERAELSQKLQKSIT